MERTEKILRPYSSIQRGQSILCGYIFDKFFQKYGTHSRKVTEWATLENAKNGFPLITTNSVKDFGDFRIEIKDQTFLNSSKNVEKL